MHALAFSRTLVVALALGGLSACGGGGSSGAPADASTPPEVPLAASFKTYLGVNRSGMVLLSGSVSDGTSSVPIGGWLEYAQVVSDDSFEGASVRRRRFTTQGAVWIPPTPGSGLSGQSDLMLGSNGLPVGLVTAARHCLTGYTVPPLPAHAQGGESGTWYTYNCYSDASKTTLLGTGTMTYAVTARSASTVRLALTDTYAPLSDTDVVSVDTFEVSTASVVTPITSSITQTTSGVTTRLVYTYDN